MYEVNPTMPSLPFTKILALDFETYYDQEYSLRNPKISMSEYIRDPRFKAHGLGYHYLDAGESVGETTWVSHGDVAAFLAGVEWDSTALLCHNTAFDGLILSHHYGHIPTYYLDTLSIARGLHDHSIGAGLDEVAEHYGLGGKVTGVLESVKGKRILTLDEEIHLASYCINDVDVMIRIFERMIENYPDDELDLIHLTINAFCNPVLEVDHSLAREELISEVSRRETTLESVAELIIDGGIYEAIHEQLQDEKPYKTELGKEKGAALARKKRNAIPPLQRVQSLLSSNKTFPQIISYLGETVAEKQGKKGLIPAVSKNDLEFQRLQASDVPHVSEVCEARLIVKSTIGETRAARLIQHSLPRLPILLNYCKAHTTRWSGGDKLNPQNFPAERKGNKARLRRAITAPKGYVIGVADSSQIEDRMNCWMAGQDDILQLYAEDGDAYGYTAEVIYGAPRGSITKATNKAKRDQGKVARLGLGYGCGVDKYRLINQVGAFGPPQPHFSHDDAERDVKKYRTANSNIVGFWYFLNDDILPLMMRGEEYEWIPPHADRSLLRFHPRGVEMPNGLTLWYPDLRATPIGRDHYRDYNYKAGKNGGRAKIYGGLFCENLIQALARVVVGEQMLKIAERYRVVMMTHDEVIFLIPENEADEGLAWSLDIMSQPPKWAQTLPVAAEGGWDKVYSK